MDFKAPRKLHLYAWISELREIIFFMQEFQRAGKFTFCLLEFQKKEGKVKFDFVTQPLMLLVFYGQWEHYDSSWNVGYLGFIAHFRKDYLDRAKVLHWNGKGTVHLDMTLGPT